MPLKYCSGEEIRKGDRIRLGTEYGVIEFIADPAISDPDTRWYVEEHGDGVMLSVERLGLVFADHPQEDDELEFVSRGDPKTGDESRMPGFPTIE